jgi:hypothetical protein
MVDFHLFINKSINGRSVWTEISNPETRETINTMINQILTLRAKPNLFTSAKHNLEVLTQKYFKLTDKKEAKQQKIEFKHIQINNENDKIDISMRIRKCPHCDYKSNSTNMATLNLHIKHRHPNKISAITEQESEPTIEKSYEKAKNSCDIMIKEWKKSYPSDLTISQLSNPTTDGFWFIVFSQNPETKKTMTSLVKQSGKFYVRAGRDLNFKIDGKQFYGVRVKPKI